MDRYGRRPSRDRSPPRIRHRSSSRDAPRSRSPPRRRSPPRNRSPVRNRSPPRHRSPPRQRDSSRDRHRSPPPRRRDRDDSEERGYKRQRPDTSECHQHRLWVGGLPHQYGKAEVLDLFEKFGPITVCDPRKGFAFLEFHHPEDAMRARDAMHGHEPERGRVLLVEFRLRTQERVEHRVPESYVQPRPPAPSPRRDYRDEPRPRTPERPRRDYRDEPRRDYRDEPRRDYRDEPRRDHRDEPRRDYRDEPRRDHRDEPRPRTPERPRGGPIKNWRLDIDGLGDSVAWQEIKDWARDGGLRVEYTAVLSGGRGTIEFPSRNEMEKAQGVLRDKPLGGAIVQLTEARIQPDTIGR